MDTTNHRNKLRLAWLTACIVWSAAGPAAARDASASDHPRFPAAVRSDRSLEYEAGVPAGAASATDPDRARVLRFGEQLYAVHCASCHGVNLQGSSGVPSLAHDGGAAVDFYVRTGRMPGAIVSGQAAQSAAHFDEQQIDAIDTYVGARAQSSVPIPAVHLTGTLAHGRSLFEENCQACHGAAAQGAIVGDGWLAVPLADATPVEIGEAVRIGPGMMPRFSRAQLSLDDIDALATYIRFLTHAPQNYGGTTADDLGPPVEGLIGAVLGVGTLFFVIFFTGTKADGSRLHVRRKDD